jgi:hypothetical protein
MRMVAMRLAARVVGSVTKARVAYHGMAFPQNPSCQL